MFYEDFSYENRRDSLHDFPEDIETSRLRYIMEIYDVSEEEARRIIDEG